MARLQLTRLSLHKSYDGGPFVGDPCRNNCAGVLGVYSMRHKDGFIIRYLSCNVCDWKPAGNKLILPDPNYQRDDPRQGFLFEQGGQGVETDQNHGS